MLDFFVALFGGAFWFTKIGHENSKISAHDRWSKKSRAINEKIKSDWSYDYRLRDNLKDADKRREFLITIGPALREVFGDSWRENFNDLSGLKTSLSSIYNPWDVAIHIFLAKECGRIPQNCYEYDVPANREWREIVFKTCKIIERNIQKRYPEMRIVLDCRDGCLNWEHDVPPRNPTERLWRTKADDVIEEMRKKEDKRLTKQLIITWLAILILLALFIWFIASNQKPSYYYY